MQKLINALAFEEPYFKKETVDKTYNHIAACLRFAIENGDLYTSPMNLVRKIPQKNFPQQSQPAPYTIFDDNDMKKILIEAEAKHGTEDKYSYGHHIVFLMYSGLRIGEASALQWKDIDFKKKLVTINKSLSTVKSLDKEAVRKTELVVGEAKTSSSNRIILLFDVAFHALLKIKEQCADHSELGCVFQTSKGKAQGGRNINRCLLEMQTNAKTVQQGLSVHDLRHTFCSYCARKDMQPKVLQDYVGHSDGAITNKYYIHTTDDQTKLNIAMMNADIIEEHLK